MLREKIYDTTEDKRMDSLTIENLLTYDYKGDTSRM